MADFDPEVVTTEAEVAESLRMSGGARDAGAVKEIMDTTDAVAVQLDSSWWGNEAFGHWSEWFLVKPDGVSPSGKALFVREGVVLREVVGKFTGAKRMAEGHNGYTSEAARRTRRKAFHWFDDSQKPGPGTLPTDERDSFKSESVPLSVIKTAFRLPESEGHAVFTDDGVREGKMSEGDIRVVGTKDTRYGAKVVLEGDTYSALSQDADNVLSETEWDDHHTTFDGDEWVSDAKKGALTKVINALNDAGYSVAVTEDLMTEDLNLALKD